MEEKNNKNKLDDWLPERIKGYIPPKIRENNFLNKYPFLFGVIIIVVSLVFVLYNLNSKNLESSMNELKILGVQEEKCTVDDCSNFMDGKWEGLDGFDRLDNKRLILSPKVNDIFSDRTLYYNEEIDPNYIIKFRILPQSLDKINLFIRYGNYRCLIGNGDYKQLACEENVKFPSIPELWQPVKELQNQKEQRWIGGSAGIRPKKELDVRVESKSIEESDKILIKLTISYFPNNNSINIENDTFEYHFSLPYKTKTFKDKFGIGLIDPERLGQIKAEFIDFQLNKTKI